MSADITVLHSRDIPASVLEGQRLPGTQLGWFIVACRFEAADEATTVEEVIAECIRPDECFVGPYPTKDAALDAMVAGAWL